MRMLLRLAALSLGLFVLAPTGGPGLGAQAPTHVERAESPEGFVISCEVFCSESRLRTANARIRWSASKPGPAAERLSATRPSLQTTVFPQGFEKSLYVSLPLGGGTPIEAAGQSQARRSLRAYQIAIVESERPRILESGTTESGVVVEGLEPGMTYAWRVAAEGAGGGALTPVVTCQAPVCPADMVRDRGEAAPRRQR